MIAKPMQQDATMVSMPETEYSHLKAEVVWLKAQVDKLKAERDELLAACQFALERSRLRAAIAKAEESS